MAKTQNLFSYHLPGDRPSTPPDLPREKQKHPHPLRANPTPLPVARSSTKTASSRRLPANPPTTPSASVVSDESPSPGTRRPQSPLSPPATPPPLPPQGLATPSFKFSKRLMNSKKLSSSVHGKPTWPDVSEVS